MSDTLPEVPSWLATAATLAVAALGTLGGFIIALVNRTPALQSAIDQRLQTLIEGYEKRIVDLTEEVHSLREEVKSLRQALDVARAVAD
jgi:cell division protein FtsB